MEPPGYWASVARVKLLLNVRLGSVVDCEGPKGLKNLILMFHLYVTFGVLSISLFTSKWACLLGLINR